MLPVATVGSTSFSPSTTTYLFVSASISGWPTTSGLRLTVKPDSNGLLSVSFIARYASPFVVASVFSDWPPVSSVIDNRATLFTITTRFERYEPAISSPFSQRFAGVGCEQRQIHASSPTAASAVPFSSNVVGEPSAFSCTLTTVRPSPVGSTSPTGTTAASLSLHT